MAEKNSKLGEILEEEVGKAVPVLYGNLQSLYVNLLQMFDNLPAEKKKYAEILRKDIEGAIEACKPDNAKIGAESKIRILTGTFRDAAVWLTDEVGILFLGYEPGPNMPHGKHRTYAYETNVESFCRAVEPFILREVERVGRKSE